MVGADLYYALFIFHRVGSGSFRYATWLTLRQRLGVCWYVSPARLRQWRCLIDVDVFGIEYESCRGGVIVHWSSCFDWLFIQYTPRDKYHIRGTCTSNHGGLPDCNYTTPRIDRMSDSPRDGTTIERKWYHVKISLIARGKAVIRRDGKVTHLNKVTGNWASRLLRVECRFHLASGAHHWIVKACGSPF